MLEIRPDLQPEYSSLFYQGLQFPEPHGIVQLTDLTFEHHNRGAVPIHIDPTALAMQGNVYVGDSALRAALEEYGIESQDWEGAHSVLDHYFDPKSEALVWGVSGYATGGINAATGQPFGYGYEAFGLQVLYDYLLREDKAPSVVIDGGVSEGFLALNSVIARSAGIPTLGFIPKQGLASVGVRDHLIVAGNTYKERQSLVGTADIIVCAGGAEGTEMECIYAIGRGASVLMLDFVDYPPSSFPKNFQANEELRQAYSDGRLVICETYDAIPDSVEQILQADLVGSRPTRRRVITDFLARP